MQDASWPRPSESRRVRRYLYLGEGLIVGGLLAAIGILPLFRGLRFLDSGSLPLSVATAAILVGFALAVAWKLPAFALAVAQGGTRHRSPAEQDWRDTRRWRWVIGLALVVVVAVIGVSAGLWGWEQTATSFVSRWPAVMALFGGLAIYAFALPRLGVYSGSSTEES